MFAPSSLQAKYTGDWIDVVVLAAALVLAVVGLGRLAAGSNSSRGKAVALSIVGGAMTLIGIAGIIPVVLADRHHGGAWNHVVLLPLVLMVLGPILGVTEAVRVSVRPAGGMILVDLGASLVVTIGLSGIVLIVVSYGYPATSTWLFAGELTFAAGVLAGTGLSLWRARARRQNR